MTKAIFFDFFGVLERHGEPNTEIREFLQTHNNKYLFGVLSAASIDLTPWLEQFGMAEYFSLIETTRQIGMSKTNQKFYKKALQIFELKPEEVIFVDDNQFNIQTAESLGIPSLYYNSHKNFLSQIKPLLN